MTWILLEAWYKFGDTRLLEEGTVEKRSLNEDSWEEVVVQMENERGVDDLVTEEAGCGDGDTKVGFNGIIEATGNSSSTSLPSAKRNADKP